MKVPATYKWKKIHKIDIYKNRNRGTYVSFGNYGIQALMPKMLGIREILSARNVLNKECRKHGQKIWLRITTNIPQTKKPVEVKLGKGIGKIGEWLSPVRFGTILFEFNSISIKEAQRIHRLVSDKVSVPTQLNYKYKYLQNA